jgi:hypothetical protein
VSLPPLESDIDTLKEILTCSPAQAETSLIYSKESEADSDFFEYISHDIHSDDPCSKLLAHPLACIPQLDDPNRPESGRPVDELEPRVVFTFSLAQLKTKPILLGKVRRNNIQLGCAHPCSYTSNSRRPDCDSGVSPHRFRTHLTTEIEPGGRHCITSDDTWCKICT